MNVYDYEYRGRRPVMWLMLAIGLAFATGLWTEGAPVFAWLILGGYLALVLWSLIGNPIYGLRLSDDALEIEPHRNTRRIALDAIEYLTIDERYEDTRFRLYLKDGLSVDLHYINAPSANETAQAFSERGVDVRRT